MNILSLSALFSEILNQQVYAINFPSYEKGTFIKLEITSGVEELGGVMDFNVQFMVKANHPSDSERVAIEIIDKIDMKTNIDFNEGVYQLILAKASSSQPFFIGESSVGEFIFTADFRLLVNRL